MMPTWRVAYSGALAPTLELLHAPHLAHATRISFGNLDTLLGRPISLDPGDLQAKLVRGCRGGDFGSFALPSRPVATTCAQTRRAPTRSEQV
jgi:hypothetical protein